MARRILVLVVTLTILEGALAGFRDIHVPSKSRSKKIDTSSDPQDENLRSKDTQRPGREKRACLDRDGTCQLKTDTCPGDVLTGKKYCKKPSRYACCVPPPDNDTCMIAGGKCQPLSQDCDGALRTDWFYCRDSGISGCCIPPGCVFGDKAYPNGTIIGQDCIQLLCNQGEWIPNFDECKNDAECTGTNCPDPPTPCACTINKGFGCTLGAPTTPGHACRCSLTGPLINANTTCTGIVVDCNNPSLQSCKTVGEDYDHCMQGVFGIEGNCGGYAVAKYVTTVSVVTPII